MNAISDSLSARFAYVAVRGEMTGFTRAASGHCYFTVKDEGGAAALRCVMFRRSAQAQAQWPVDGHLVEVKGRLGVYELRGELQLVADAIALAGAGSLYERYLRLKAKLEGEGLFDAQRKRGITRFPRAVGVVTSTAGAALHDVVSTLARRSPHVRVLIYPCAVQGQEAPAQIVAALQAAASRLEVQTLILCRGGGSLEDLWAFNDEAVVRAVAASPIPIICGVGHETDSCLADFAADLRAATPTGAAELVACAQIQAQADLQGLRTLLAQRVTRLLQFHGQRLDRAGLRLARPAQALMHYRQALHSLQQRMSQAPRLAMVSGAERLVSRRARLRQALRVALAGQQTQLRGLGQRLRALDPSQVLERGYAWLQDADGRPVTSVRHAAVGSDLTAQLADGQVHARVSAVHPTSDV